MTWLIERLPELVVRSGEHILLTAGATTAAFLIGLPLGLWASRSTRLRVPLLAVVSIVQTVPSLAMLAILLALIGQIGTLPALIALILYALLPIVRNTISGIENIPPEVVDAARGIGMTPGERLRLVELPLALPVIIAGVRTAAVLSVGVATLSAFIGAGGLGQFINRGLALSDTSLILLGAIPAAILALLVDGSVATLHRAWAQPQSSRSRSAIIRKTLGVSAPLALCIGGVLAVLPWDSAREGSSVLRVGSKNFTEQLILGEIQAQLLESHTDLRIERHFNLGGTMICHQALVNGEIDLYAEYTGTALTAILGRRGKMGPEDVFPLVSRLYETEFRLIWLPVFGFNNTYVLAVREEESKALQSLSDLAARAAELRAGFTAEFAERPDGYPGLQQAYDLAFASVTDLDPSLLYEAIAGGAVDIISSFATDGRIEAYDLRVLEDDRSFFPPYHAATVIRSETLSRLPEVGVLLRNLEGTLDDETMRRLNLSVEQGETTPAEAARRFLEERNLLKPAPER